MTDHNSANGDTPTGFATAFDIYHQRGWSVMPIPPDAKKPPPTGFTGHDGAIPSYADMLAWADDKPDHNTSIRLSRDGCGIDVDNYGGKNGAATLAHAESLWGTLPPTYYSTSRDDGESKIRLYRIPEGVELQTNIEFKKPKLGGIEICQFHHRYVMCWPSIHPDTGNQYRWFAPDGTQLDGPPAFEDLPELPAAWLDALRVDTTHNGAELLSDDAVDVPVCMTEGEIRTGSPASSARLWPNCLARTAATTRYVSGFSDCCGWVKTVSPV
jgi:hypothetical protein